jgi:hypothetical protein
VLRSWCGRSADAPQTRGGAHHRSPRRRPFLPSHQGARGLQRPTISLWKQRFLGCVNTITEPDRSPPMPWSPDVGHAAPFDAFAARAAPRD